MKNCLLALLIMAQTALADTPVQDNDRGLDQAPQVVLMAASLQGSERIKVDGQYRLLDIPSLKRHYRPVATGRTEA